MRGQRVSGPGSVATYTRWLRDLLVSHGMCSFHLEDNFVRLATAVAEVAGRTDRGAA